MLMLAYIFPWKDFEGMEHFQHFLQRNSPLQGISAKSVGDFDKDLTSMD